jgi:hypothetical protein
MCRIRRLFWNFKLAGSSGIEEAAFAEDGGGEGGGGAIHALGEVFSFQGRGEIAREGAEARRGRPLRGRRSEIGDGEEAEPPMADSGWRRTEEEKAERLKF